MAKPLWEIHRDSSERTGNNKPISRTSDIGNCVVRALNLIVYDPDNEGDFRGTILIDKNNCSRRSFTVKPHNLEECAMRAIVMAGSYPKSFITIVWQRKRLCIKSSELMAIVDPINDLPDRIRAVVDLMK